MQARQACKQYWNLIALVGTLIYSQGELIVPIMMALLRRGIVAKTEAIVEAILGYLDKKKEKKMKYDVILIYEMIKYSFLI